MTIQQTLCAATDSNRRNTEASIVPLRDGALLFAYTHYQSSARDDGSASIRSKLSYDGGKTWTPSCLLQENTGKLNVMSASLLRLSSGAIGLTYIEKNSHSSASLFFRSSEDEGETWSGPIRMTEGDGYQIMLNDSLYQASSGRLLVPAYRTHEAWSKNENIEAYTCFSDDEGMTWQRSENLVRCPGRGAMEPCFFENKSGVLQMYFRTDQGRLWMASSNDEGLSWGESGPSPIISPEAPARIARIPSTGDLLLIWNPNYVAGADHGGPRFPLSGAISFDDGASWGKPVQVDARPGKTYSYPSIAFDGDDVLITYYSTAFREALGDTCDLRISLEFLRCPVETFYSAVRVAPTSLQPA